VGQLAGDGCYDFKVSNPWPNCPTLPRHAAAVLGALHLDEPELSGLGQLTEREWRAALDYADRERITLALRGAARGQMPEWVCERVDRDAGKNQVRLRGIEQTYRDLAEWFGEAGIEFVILKGVSHGGLFGPRADGRVQYDIDLWLPRDHVAAAQSLLIGRGYEALPGTEDLPTDHLPALARKTGWQWRGDFFDPEIPLPIELHFQFWNQRLERFDAPGIAEFWDRRTRRPLANALLPTLHPADAVAYAALHVLKHVLVGSVRVAHVFEIAAMLQARARDDAFWAEWRELHPDGLRRLETIVFRLAREWFGGRAARAVEEEIARLPANIGIWFEEFAVSPATQGFHANKDHLWLHLCLLDSWRDAWAVVALRLLPHSLPAAEGDSFVAKEDLTWRDWVRWRLHWAAYTGERAWHHAAALPAMAVSGARWWWRTNSLGRQFWIFLLAAVVFNFGLFIFALLYNLFLLDLGFREDFLGVVNGAQRAGSVVGTLPAAWIAHRFGLRKTLLVAIAGLSAAEVLRAVVGARFPLAALAFVTGCMFATWAVILAPSIAGVVEEKRRPVAFSVFFAVMFAVGIAGNWLGGRLPLWLHGKQPVLLWVAALSAVALLPAWFLRIAAPGGGESRVYPRGRFLIHFLVPFALWHLATGAFNPFNNVYFARMGFAVERIGSVFSASQVVQVGAVLLAPWVIRRMGLVSGIVWMMAATAFCLGGLAVHPSAGGAVAAYMAYMSFQWMSEPGLNTLLMNGVAERERGGASALNFLVAFGAQALAAWGAGALFSGIGYGPVLGVAAAMAAISAGLFRVLLRPAPCEPATPDGSGSA
jgi:MFS family permease